MNDKAPCSSAVAMATCRQSSAARVSPPPDAANHTPSSRRASASNRRLPLVAMNSSASAMTPLGLGKFPRLQQRFGEHQQFVIVIKSSFPMTLGCDRFFHAFQALGDLA